MMGALGWSLLLSPENSSRYSALNYELGCPFPLLFSFYLCINEFGEQAAWSWSCRPRATNVFLVFGCNRVLSRISKELLVFFFLYFSLIIALNQKLPAGREVSERGTSTLYAISHEIIQRSLLYLYGRRPSRRKRKSGASREGPVED